MISLRVPALLVYRDVAMRVASAGCKIFAASAKRLDPHQFQEELVSALGEAFNNTVLHAYRGRSDGRVTIEIEQLGELVEVRILDEGTSFDLSKVPVPELDALPESGMGLFIIRSFTDELAYRPGPPNVLSLRKYL